MNLQETIRRVLKEDRVSNIANQYINQFGLRGAAKMMGISVSKIVEMSNTPIDSKIAYDILDENLNNGKLKNKYKEFRIESNYDGVFYWEGELETGYFIDNYKELVTVMATPFWDGEDYTPVEIDWFTLLDKSRPAGLQNIIDTEGHGSFYQELRDKTSFDSVEELLDWYHKVYLPGVYNIIMHLLPEMHIFISEKLDENRRDN